MTPPMQYRMLGATDVNFVNTLTQVGTALVEEPARRIARYALLGAVGGTLLAATFGLAGGTVGPGNRSAVLGLLVIPLAGTFAGVLLAKQSLQTLVRS